MPQIYLMHAESVIIGESWNIDSVRSPFWRLYIHNRDRAAVVSAAGRHELTPARVHLVPAYMHFACRNSRPVVQFYVHFEVLGIPPMLQQRLFARPLSLPLSPLSKTVRDAFAGGASPSPAAAQLCLAQAVVLESLAGAIAGLPPGQQERLQETLCEPQAIRPAMELLRRRLPAAVAVSELAESCSLSPDHFSRLFRRQMGQSPAQYVLHARLTMAGKALRYSSAAIETIASIHGFANRFHFTRAFTQAMGATPAAYRKAPKI